MFDISFVEHGESTGSTATGRIQIGTFTDKFESSLEFWRKQDYEQHWQQSVSRVVSARANSCLITSVTPPRTAHFLFWWPIYVISDSSIVIQNQVLFLNEGTNKFDLDFPHRSLRSRQTVSKEGERISEWRSTIDELDDWLRAKSS